MLRKKSHHMALFFSAISIKVEEIYLVINNQSQPNTSVRNQDEPLMKPAFFHRKIYYYESTSQGDE